MPFEPGHTLSPGKNGKPWQQAIKQALKERENGDDPKALRKLANKLLIACDKGDISALRELGDRVDGKSTEHKIIEHRSFLDDMTADELIEFRKSLAKVAEGSTSECGSSPQSPETGTIQTQH